MLARTPLRELAIAWLETQDPEGRYNWGLFKGCACAQMARALGREEEWKNLGTSRLSDEWDEFNTIALGPEGAAGWTFGAFLERLKAAA